MLLGFSAIAGADQGRVSVIPRPARIVRGEGVFTLSPQTKIRVARDSQEANAIGLALADLLSQGTRHQYAVEEATDLEACRNSILLAISRNNWALGPEGYQLTATPGSVVLRALRPAGLFYGVQTLRQLLPPEIEGQKPLPRAEWTIPCVQIEDQPRFKWRGLLLDCARTFWDKEYLKRYVDLLALYKMNVLQLHLTDDEGWRVEIKKHPKLTSIGSKYSRPYDSPEGYYSEDDIRELVGYAASRHVTIVPEIEMPGHSNAAVAAYPELSCTGGPFEIHPYFPSRGKPRGQLCAGNDQTFALLEDVLSEVVELFPSAYIHIGADEVNKQYWRDCPKCRACVKAEGLANVHELHSYLVRRMARFLAGKNRRLIGWDEIMEGRYSTGERGGKGVPGMAWDKLTPADMPPDVTVMAWRAHHGPITGVRAAQLGLDVVMSPTSHCYFDYPYAKISTEKTYSFEPIPDESTDQQARHVLGAQANMWTHIATTETAVDKQVFPRLLALAEVVWSPKELRDWKDFSRRLNSHDARLDQLDVRRHDPFIPVDRAPALAKRGRLTSTSGVWKNYHLEYAFDGDPASYYWNDRPIISGDSVTLTLDQAEEFSRVEVHTGIPEIAAARLHHGVLEISADGETFVTVAQFRNGTAAAELKDQTVRAIRIRAVADQGRKWLMVREIILEAGAKSTLKTDKPIEPLKATD